MEYDVFLSHNSKDKPIVKAIEDWLVAHDVTVFLDEKDLLPGDRLTDKLGKAMEESHSAIVCLGPYGEGPWQGEEMASLLSKAIAVSQRKDEFRIIPVLLPGADTTNLSWFLQTRLWIDLSKGLTDHEAELFRLRHAIRGTSGDAPVEHDPKFNPYLGLKAFQQADSDFFFGRGQENAQLAAMVRDWRFAFVVGPSGNGKSSLARAGLGTEAAEAQCPGIREWRRLVAVPGADLLRSILGQIMAGRPEAERAAAVDAAVRRVVPDDAPVTAETWAAGLANELAATFPDPSARVILVLDQMEEIFTHRGLQVTNEEARQQRIRLVLGGLAALVSLRDPRWHLVLTMRDDFYERCRVSEPFWKLVSADRLSLQLDELNEEGWRAAIKGPAARAGAYLEAGLVETMLKDVYRQRGSMPLLQLALQQLWTRRRGACLTHAAYTSIGGVADALQTQAARTLQLLGAEDPEYLEIARNLFLRLTSLGEGVSDTRRRMPRYELLWEKTDPAAVERVLARLSDAENRLIVESKDAVEVTHEILIRKCNTIRDWIEEARPQIPILRRLTHAAQRWLENERDLIFLNAADPPRELKLWFQKKTLRVTALEREYWQASRGTRRQTHVEKRTQRRNLAEEKRKLVESERNHFAEDARQAKIKNRLLQGIGMAFAAGAIVALIFYLGAEEARENEAKARAISDQDKKAAEAAKKTAEEEKAKAVAAKADAEHALANYFVRVIGSGPYPRLSPDEEAAVWELCRASESVKELVVTPWLEKASYEKRIHEHRPQAMQAVVGLSPELRQYAASSAVPVLERVWKENDTTGRWPVIIFGESAQRPSIEILATFVSPDQVAPCAHRALKALNATEDPSVYLFTITQLAKRLPAADAPTITKGLVTWCELQSKKKVWDINVVPALSALLPRISPEEAHAASERLLATCTKTKAFLLRSEADGSLVWDPEQAARIRVLAPYLDSHSREKVGISIFGQPTDDQIPALEGNSLKQVDELAVLASALPAGIADRIFIALMKYLRLIQAKDPAEVLSLPTEERLLTLIKPVDAPFAAEEAKKSVLRARTLSNWMRRRHPHSEPVPDTYLRTLGTCLDNATLEALKKEIAEEIAEPKTLKMEQQPAIVGLEPTANLRVLSLVLGSRVDPKQALAMAQKCIRLLETEIGDGEVPLEPPALRACGLIETLVSLLPADSLTSIADQVLQLRGKMKHAQFDSSEALSRTIQAIAERLPEAERSELAARWAGDLSKRLVGAAGNVLYKIGDDLADLLPLLPAPDAVRIRSAALYKLATFLEDHRIHYLTEEAELSDIQKINTMVEMAALSNFSDSFDKPCILYGLARRFVLLAGEAGTSERDIRMTRTAFKKLSSTDLVTFLKWPASTQFQDLVLEELEARISTELKAEIKFGGSVFEFLKQAHRFPEELRDALADSHTPILPVLEIAKELTTRE